MVEERDIVLEVRVTLIGSLQWAGSEITDSVLAAVAAVPYRGDRDAYMKAVVPTITSTLGKAIHPLLDDAGVDDIVTRRVADLVAKYEKFLHDIEAFKQMETPQTPH